MKLMEYVEIFLVVLWLFLGGLLVLTWTKILIIELPIWVAIVFAIPFATVSILTIIGLGILTVPLLDWGFQKVSKISTQIGFFDKDNSFLFKTSLFLIIPAFYFNVFSGLITLINFFFPNLSVDWVNTLVTQLSQSSIMIFFTGVFLIIIDLRRN